MHNRAGRSERRATMPSWAARAMGSSVAILMLASCQPATSGAPPRQRVPAPRTAESTAPSEQPPPSLFGPPPQAASAPPSDLPLPEAPPGADPELVAFAASICAAAVLKTPQGTTRVGCRSHPPFDGREQQPDGKIITHQGDPLLFCAIGQVYRGSFAEPGLTEAVLAFEQCKKSENAPWDMAFPGNLVVVEKTADRWRAVAFEPDLDAFGCLTFHRTDGRDLLVCKGSFAGWHDGGLRWLDAIDLSKPAGKRVQHFAELTFNDFSIPCSFDPSMIDGLPFVDDGSIVRVEFGDMALRDTDGDGASELVLPVRRARFAIQGSFAARARRYCRSDEDSIDPAEYLPKPERATLVYRYDGKRFVPTPATHKRMAAWKATSPQRYFSFRSW